MGDKFPKQYVIERLQARQASLTSKLEAGEAMLREVEAAESAKAVGYMNQILQMTDDVQALHRRQNERPTEERDPWAEMEELVHEMSLPTKPYRRRDRAAWQRSDPEPGSLSEYLSKKTAWRAEIGKIQHALAYLEELPITELSITAITKLKLTDAIAFDLKVKEKTSGR